MNLEKTQRVYPSQWKAAVRMDVPSAYTSISAEAFWSQNCREPAHAFSSLQRKPAAGGAGKYLHQLPVEHSPAQMGLLLGTCQLPPEHSMAQLAMGVQGMFVRFSCSAQQACGYRLLLCQEQGGRLAK